MGWGMSLTATGLTQVLPDGVAPGETLLCPRPIPGGAISKCAHLCGGFLARTVAQILLRQIDDQSELHNAILPIPSATGCRTCTVYGCCLSTPRAILKIGRVHV